MMSFVATASALAPLIVHPHPSGWLELRLNRPEKLNALSLELVDALTDQVADASSADVCGVLLSAAPGRAFCAGGDISQVASLPLAKGQAFLNREYRLMMALHEIGRTKPVVALADGFVIGAGAGLFMAASHRASTLASSFSMPECVLGIVPDCGATDWLQSAAMPEHLGQWAALTGARLAAPMMASTGLTTHIVSGETAAEASTAADELRARLLSCEDAAAVDAALADEEFVAAAVAEFVGEETLMSLDAAAARTFGAGLVGLDERLQAEKAAAQAAGDDIVLSWANDSRAKLARGCPAALLVAYECALAGRSLGSDGALETTTKAAQARRRSLALGMEYAANSLLAGRPDFQEGVACAVGGKKGAPPQWAHPSIEAAAEDPALQEVLERVASADPLALA